jgi:hypothetical protein
MDISVNNKLNNFLRNSGMNKTPLVNSHSGAVASSTGGVTRSANIMFSVAGIVNKNSSSKGNKNKLW